MGKKVVLQSGFVSLTKDGLITPSEDSHFYNNIILNKSYRHASNRHHYSESIVRLYTNYRSNPLLLKKFDFRKQILTEAKKAFSTKSFYEWLEVQVKKASLSKLHTMFLYDTMDYIVGYDDNADRSMHVEQWVRLLERTDDTDAVEIDVRKYLSDYKRDSVNYIPNDINELLQQWVSKRGGYADLLVSLFVVFGNRPYITDVKV